MFTETTEQIPLRHRLTGRLRAKLEEAASVSARSCADVAREYRVSDWSMHKCLLDKAISPIGEPHQVRRLGLDETRTRSVRWVLDQAGWRRTDPWMTSFVDLNTDHAGGLLGLIPGRSGAAVDACLGQQSDEWKAAIEIVALDPSAPFAATIRRHEAHPKYERSLCVSLVAILKRQVREP